MKFGVDCASPATNTSGLKAGHVEFVCRYLSPPGNTKNLTKGEAASLIKAGLDIVVVWEQNGTEPVSGHASTGVGAPAGVQDARLAAAEAAAVGMPHGSPIYFALDEDPNALTAAQWTAVEGYFKGVASVLGVSRTGAYGGYALIKHLFDRKLIHYGWQTYAWSGGQWDSRAQLRQYLNAQTIAGISVDFDHAVTADFGQWRTTPPPRVIDHHTVQYHDKHGRIQQRITKHPRRWGLLHPGPYKHGAVTYRRVFKK